MAPMQASPSVPQETAQVTAMAQSVYWDIAETGSRTAPQGMLEGAPFYPVTTQKFIVMSICTFALYEIYWAYKNWQHIRDTPLRENLIPFWRAFFSPLWAFSLFKHVREDAERQGLRVAWQPSLLAAFYIGLTIIPRLLDPFFLLISLGTFVPFLPVVETIKRINMVSGLPKGAGGRYSAANVVIAVIGALFLFLVLIGLFLPVDNPVGAFA